MLKTLYSKVFHSNDIDINKFKNDTAIILDYLKDLQSNKRKTTLSSLLIISPNEKRYRDLILHDIHQYNEQQNEDTKNEKHEKIGLVKLISNSNGGNNQEECIIVT